jgi:hypothetical protein
MIWRGSCITERVTRARGGHPMSPCFWTCAMPCRSSPSRPDSLCSPFLCWPSNIGANTAVFSFIDAVCLKRLPVAQSDRLGRLYAKGPSGNYGAGFSYPEFELVRDHTFSFAALSLEAPVAQLHLVNGSDSEKFAESLYPPIISACWEFNLHSEEDFLHGSRRLAQSRRRSHNQ